MSYFTHIKVFSIIVAVLLFSHFAPLAYANQIQIVTNLGNVYTVNANQTNTNSTNSTNSVGGTGNGLGTGAQIIIVKPQGTVVSGTTTNVGTTFQLKPYNKVTSGTFAAGFQNSDSVQKLPVSQLNAQYVYSGGTLTKNNTPAPNILSIASYSTIAGPTGSETTSSSGVLFSQGGSGTVMSAILNSGLNTTVVDGTGITGGGSVLYGIPADPSLTISAYDGGTHGYTVLTSTAYSVSGGYSVTVPVNKYVSSLANTYSTYTWNYSYCTMSAYTGWSWSCSYDSGTGVATVNGYASGNLYYVTSITFSTSDNYAAIYYPHGGSSSCSAKGGCSYSSYGSAFMPYVTLYDKSPFVPGTLSPTYTSNFEQQVNFTSSTQYDLIVTPTSSGTTIKVSSYDPTTQLYFQATGLPTSVPYQLLQNGIVSVSGVTGSDGSLKLSAAQIAAGGQSSISGELDIYPNSPSYVGTLGTAVYDTTNNKMFNISSGTPQIYTPFAYVQIPMPSSTIISNVSVNGTLGVTSLTYLSKTYTAGSTMLVPIIPGEKSISFSINGVATTVKLSTVQSAMGISIVTPSTSSNSGFRTDGSAAQVSVDTGGDAAAIAPKDGTIYALISAQVSADTSFSSGATYNYQQTAVQYIYEDYNPSTGWYTYANCPQGQFLASGCQDNLTYAPSGAHAGPLTVYIDTYVNGVMVGSQIVYNNQNPVIQQSSSVSNWSLSSSSAMAMHYAQSSAAGLVQVQVHAGDLVEFYLRGHLDAWGDSIPVAKGTYGTFTTTSQFSGGSATINLNSGSILTGLG